MFERIRPIMELMGITAIVVSLLFVGWEVKQTREMDLAQLHFNRMEMFHSKMLAMLESESALRVIAKRYVKTESPEPLTAIERATAFITAQAQIAEWEAEFRYIEQGFATRTLEDLQIEIGHTARGTPEIKEAWVSWDMPGLEKYSFNTMMNEVLHQGQL